MYAVIFVEYSIFVCHPPLREVNMMKKTSVPSAPTGHTTSSCDNGFASTTRWTFFACLTAQPDRRICPFVMSVTTMMSAPSTAPAVLRAKARVPERLPAQPHLQQQLAAQQTTRRPAGAPPAVPPQTRCFPWTPLSVDPYHLSEVVGGCYFLRLSSAF